MNVHKGRLSMPRSSAYIVHAICAAFVLAVMPPAIGQQKPPPLVGKSRDQIVAQLGEPKSNIRAGTREMLFFTHLKVTLRNDVVIETEELADEPAPRHVAEPSAASSAVPGANSGQSGASTPANTPAPANADTSNAAAGKSAPDASAAPAKPPTPAEPPLEIKFIRSASSPAKPVPHPAPVAAAAAEPTPTAAPAPVPAAELKPPLPPPATLPAPAPAVANTADVTSPPAVAPEPEHPAATEEISAAELELAKPAVVDAKTKAALRKRWWRFRRDTETEDEPVSIFSTQSYVLAAIILIGGVAYLWWRRMQRNLELAVTSVSSTPFEAAMAADTATQFTAESVGKLGQRKFERLVASYYAKTGVVAERTKAGPEAPIHIKIFWKGEPKPFAGVLCLANPTALIGPQRLQELFTALTAADIRRGYVVTTGKFNVEARDVAEEKHLTLLSGDLFLEKLNALPPGARGDLLRETNAEEPAAPAAAV